MAGESAAAATPVHGLVARFTRLWQHCRVDDRLLSRRFDQAAFERIEAAIAEGEGRHRGEIRFALEGRLEAAAIWRGQTARERALEVFASHGIWDTEENTGILIYLLWADHAVEIVADRGVCQGLSEAVMQRLCRQLAEACGAGRAVEGVLATIADVHRVLEPCLGRDPAGNPDELSNRPIRL